MCGESIGSVATVHIAQAKPVRRCGAFARLFLQRACLFASHVTRHTSHVTRHTSHVTRHTPLTLPPQRNPSCSCIVRPSRHFAQAARFQPPFPQLCSELKPGCLLRICRRSCSHPARFALCNFMARNCSCTPARCSTCVGIETVYPYIYTSLLTRRHCPQQHVGNQAYPLPCAHRARYRRQRRAVSGAHAALRCFLNQFLVLNDYVPRPST